MNNDTGTYNPLPYDFECDYDLSGDAQHYKIPSKEIAYFSPEATEHIRTQLYIEIINQRGLNGIELNADPDKKNAILEEMEASV